MNPELIVALFAAAPALYDAIAKAAAERRAVTAAEVESAIAELKHSQAETRQLIAAMEADPALADLVQLRRIQLAARGQYPGEPDTTSPLPDLPPDVPGPL